MQQEKHKKTQLIFPTSKLLNESRAAAGSLSYNIRSFAVCASFGGLNKNPSRSAPDLKRGLFLLYSAVNGSSAIVLALLIAVVNWR
jgi:hypothetical protein